MGWFTRRVLICLVLGFALTIASAWLPGALLRTGPFSHIWGDGSYSWGASIFDYRPTRMGRSSAPGLDISYVSVGYSGNGQRNVPTGREPALAGVWTDWMRHKGLRRVGTYVTAGDLPFDTVCFETRGWPVRAAWCEYRYAAKAAWLEPLGAVALSGEHSVGLLAIGTLPRALPLRPIWSGLAINVGFWTTAVAPLVFAPTLIRHVRRRRAGSCPACGYDLTGAPGPICPECGRQT